MKTKTLIGLTLLSSLAISQDTLSPIEVSGKQDLESARPTWVEQDKTQILSGKKNRTSKIDYLPPIQTDNNRQHFSQQASIYAPDQTTEPWTSMSFRGIGDPHEGQNLLIMQDGLPVAIDIYGQPGNYYSPPAPLMEDLQVVAGGGALMFGPQPGGAINYISPKLHKDMPTHGKVNAAGGSYNLFSTVNKVTGSEGNTSYHAGYYRKKGDGFQRRNGDFEAQYLQFKTNTYLENNLVFKSAFQGYDSDFGMPGGLTLASGSGLNTYGKNGNRKATRVFDRLKIARALLMVGIEKKVSSVTFLDAQVWGTYYRRYNQTQTGSAFGVIPTANSNTINNTQAYGLNGDVRINHEWELNEEKNSLTVGYRTYNTDSPTVAAVGSRAQANQGRTTARSERLTRTHSIFAENKFNFGKLAVVPGFRYENITLSNENRTSGLNRQDSYNVILGGLGAAYTLNDSTQAFANVSQGFKPISYADVLSQATPTITVQGDIKPSYNYFYEAGLRGETAKISWDSSLFVIHRQNLVATSNNVLSNGSSAQYRGAEASITLKDALNSKSSHEMDFYFNGIYNNAKFHGGSVKGKTPAYVPSAVLKYGLIYRQQEKTRISLLGTWVNEHFADDAHTSNRKIPSYSLFDLLGEYGLTKNWSVNGAVNNLLDEVYYARIQNTGILPTMGRNFYAGATYKF